MGKTAKKDTGDRGWNEENERIAKAISNKHAALVWVCNRSAKRVERRQKVIGICIAAGLYLFGTTGIPSAITDSSDNENSKIALLVLSIIAILFGLFKTINVAMQEDKKVGKNRWALGIHAELTKDIRKELTRPKHKRQKWHKFYKYVEEKDIELQKDAPTPPKAVLKAYYKQFEEEAIRERILFGGLNEIENTTRITVNRVLRIDEIGKQAKKNRERKQIIRDIVAKTEESSSSSSSSGKTSESRAPTDKLDEHTGKLDEHTGNIGNTGDTGASHESSSSSRGVPPKTAPSQESSDYENYPEVKKPVRPRMDIRKSIDTRRVAAAAARHDMKDRYELERYYLE
jgi:hypothetical protein